MTLGDSFQLEVWKSDWGLPSVDVDCLKVLTYAKFCKIPVVVRETSNPFKSANGQLPVLRYINSSFCTVDKIIDVFHQHKYAPDNGITKLQGAEIAAYNTMLEDCLYPALQYVWWVDEQNLNQTIRPWYCKALSFPLSFYYPGKYEKHAKFMVEALYPNIDEKVAETSIYSKAQKCISTLSTRLGESDYFFGSTPSMLDALVFAYLAPILKIKLPSCRLQNYLKGCSNLVKFINRILQKYFEDGYQEYEKLKIQEEEKKAKANTDLEFPNKRRNQIFAGIFALVSMLGYAFSTGIVQIEDDDFVNQGSLGYYENDDENDTED